VQPDVGSNEKDVLEQPARMQLQDGKKEILS
jgi:hypothetical protein